MHYINWKGCRECLRTFKVRLCLFNICMGYPNFRVRNNWRNAGALASSTHKSIGGYRAALPETCSLVSKFKGRFQTDVTLIGVTDASTELIFTLTSPWGQSRQRSLMISVPIRDDNLGPNLRVLFNILFFIPMLTKSLPSFLLC